MIIRCFLLLIFCFSLFSNQIYAQVQSPGQFLGYQTGERFTPHHQVLNYVKHVAEQSDRVAIHTYGQTNQNRELVYLVVTSPENHQRIDEIRTNNLKITGLMEGEPTDFKKAIIWLSYNIHGNETSSSEAAMNTLHELVQTENTDVSEWLSETVVLIDPMLNPDGRERYVNWFRGITGSEYDPRVQTREHREPWPGGRSNHYYFDLNRDWAWQTQLETRQRIRIYQQWMPHVHVDFHEQSYNSPYYFAPAAEPYHEAITDWQREFQTTIGENNARYFDEEGWTYFTKQRFDLFYPSYGDTWPTFNGAIGMTYEQAGHGLAGASVITQEGDTLTLKDRITRHTTSGLSTIETTADHADQVISEFEKHFNDAVNTPSGEFKSYIVSAENHPDKLFHLLKFLESQQITYGRAGDSHSVDGYNYESGEHEQLSIDEDDIVISANQPQSQLVRVLFEPDPVLSDSLTYDITAWETHYRFGVSGFATAERLNPQDELSADSLRNAEQNAVENPYAYLIEWNSMDDAQFLSGITQRNIKSRVSIKSFTVNGKEFDRGTLVITRQNNRHLQDELDQIISNVAEKYDRPVHVAATGFAEAGPDFGSSDFQFIEEPKIAVFMGEETSSLSAGEVWHFFDQQLGYPASLFHTHHFQQADLSSFNTIVLPEGSYTDMLSEQGVKKLRNWIKSGCKLISIGKTNQIFAGLEGFNISRKTAEDESDESPEELLQKYENRMRSGIENRTPGSIFNVTLDTTHPLAFGYDENYYSLKVNADAYEYLPDGWNVGTTQENSHRSGFAGHKAKQNLNQSLTFGVQSYGSGQVVYLTDNPLFRGFWENGKLFVANALFFVD